jgi:endonuclease G
LYTNACPQHAQLNQGTWNELEDYILNNTDERNMKVSVFTGPVLKTSDPAYRGIKIPQEYWKVVAMVKPSGKLSATAYMLSQSQLMDDLELPEFKFGAFQTFQVTISKIEEETKLSFGSLKDFDPLSSSEFERTVIAISSPQDLVL